MPGSESSAMSRQSVFAFTRTLSVLENFPGPVGVRSHTIAGWDISTAGSTMAVMVTEAVEPHDEC